LYFSPLPQGQGAFRPFDLMPALSPKRGKTFTRKKTSGARRYGSPSKLSSQASARASEADMLVETPSGIFGVEARASPAVSPADLHGGMTTFRCLKALERFSQVSSKVV